MIAEDADGFYIGGATGEGIALRRDLREYLAEKAIKFVDSKIVLSCCVCRLHEVVALAKHAERCGTEAISAMWI